MYKFMVGGLLCAITGAILILPVAFSRIPNPDNDAIFIVLSTGISFLGIIVGLACCHSCKGTHLLAAGLLLLASTALGAVAMSLYTYYDVSYYFTVVCGLGWGAVFMTWLSASLYICAYMIKRRKDQH